MYTSVSEVDGLGSVGGLSKSLFQTFHVAGRKQGAHLCDSDGVKRGEALGLRHPLADENRVK